MVLSWLGIPPTGRLDSWPPTQPATPATETARQRSRKRPPTLARHFLDEHGLYYLQTAHIRFVQCSPR